VPAPRTTKGIAYDGDDWKRPWSPEPVSTSRDRVSLGADCSAARRAPQAERLGCRNWVKQPMRPFEEDGSEPYTPVARRSIIGSAGSAPATAHRKVVPMPRLLTGLVALGLAATAGWFVHAGDLVLAGVVLVVTVALAIATGSASTIDRSRPWRGASRAGHSGWDELRRELDRARRFERSFSIVLVLGGDPDPGLRLDAVAPHLRSCDRVWVSEAALYVLMPETTAKAATSTFDRMREGDAALIARAVSFPEDGLTSEALLDQLHAPDRRSATSRMAKPC